MLIRRIKFKHTITAVVGISSFCFGIWIERKYKDFNTLYRSPSFKIFDAVNADSIITKDQQLNNNEQRVSEVSFIHYFI